MSKLELLNLTLEDKIKRSKQLIFEWYHQFNTDVYVAFSGGKDSTVLLHLVRSMFPEVPAVFCDTGLEYPDIRNFVKETENVIWVKPKLNFKQVVEQYGYPIVSKEQAQYIDSFRRTKSLKLADIRINGNKWGRGKISKKWLFLLNAPFKISDKCCQIMKKEPSKNYEKETGRKPFVGVMAVESSLRMQSFNKGECNAFKAKRPVSKPLMFWTDEDVWQYIEINNVKYSKIYDKGFKRTGCMFCLFGCKDKKCERLELMKEHEPKLYEYCMDKLGLENVLNYLKEDIKSS